MVTAGDWNKAQGSPGIGDPCLHYGIVWMPLSLPVQRWSSCALALLLIPTYRETSKPCRHM